MRVADIREEFKQFHRAQVYTEDGMLELLGKSFIADEPTIFSAPSAAYMRAEIHWYNSQSLNVNDMRFSPIPKAWLNTANEYGDINSNYGYRIYSKECGYQFRNAVRKLRNDPTTRRATMVYMPTTQHVIGEEDGKNDYICTSFVNYFIRSGSIHCTVSMRSCDAILGYKNDLAWQKHVLSKVRDAVSNDLKIGTIFWYAASLHIYPRNFKEIK